MPIQKYLVRSGATIHDAIAVIDQAGMQFCMVVDGQGHLLGTVTDGDVRRGILKGVSLDSPVERICNTNPVVGRITDDAQTLDRIMGSHGLHQIPVLDSQGRVVRVKFIDDLVAARKKDNLVVLMAGGVGQRLRPLTYECPKPLLKVGDKPILEIILENYIGYGFHRIAVSVNYKADMIKEYFGDGSRWGVDIIYIEEAEPRGTAGALALLKERPEESFFVMNGDLLTKVNFLNLLGFHEEGGCAATVCVRNYSYNIPYGVMDIQGDRVAGIEEKPVQQCFVNAGIYLLTPRCLDLVPRDCFFDMPDLLRRLLAGNETVCSFPLREYWLDIGRMSDFERANCDFSQQFEISDFRDRDKR